MPQSSIYQKIREAADAIQVRAGIAPQLGIVLGSGLGAVSESVEDPVIIPYTDIPHFHGTSVEGHIGRMLIGKFQGIPTVFLQGRFHLYEGYPMEDVVFPTRAISALGIQTLCLTNAAGGINTNFKAGDLMVIEDHINMMGDNPLKGPHIAQLGPRFPDLSEAYSKAHVETVLREAVRLGIKIHRGIYAGVLGPTYETPAEIRMLRTLGADAVGMSTVPESIAANHLGIRVVGISCITNLAAGLTSRKLTHAEVLEISKEASIRLASLLQGVAPHLIEQHPQTETTQ